MIYILHFYYQNTALSSTYFYNDINQDDKTEFLILSIHSDDISDFINFDYNTRILCNHVFQILNQLII